MPTRIYAGTLEHHPLFGASVFPLLPAGAWADMDADAQFEATECWDHRPDASTHACVGVEDASALFGALGIDISTRPSTLDIATVHKAALRLLNSPRALGHTLLDAARALSALIADSRRLGATHLVVC